MSQQQELDVLRKVEFDWAVRLSNIWNDSAWDVPELHSDIRNEFAAKLKEMSGDTRPGSPLGWVLVGTAGSGKTHLIGNFRQEAARQRASFVLVDLTDVSEFWSNVLQGYLDSLQVIYEGDQFQYQCLLRNLLNQQFSSTRPVSDILEILAKRPTESLAKDIQKIINSFHKRHRQEILKYNETIRALVCMNSDDFTIANAGMAWLQGQSIETELAELLGFSNEVKKPQQIVEALSWMMSLGGPTVLVFDQLDPIVTELEYRKIADESIEGQSAAKAIVANIGGGLGALRDVTKRTLVVVSCIESTWSTLGETVLASSVDRFQVPRSLQHVGQDSIVEQIVASRLAVAFQASGFKAPFPTWPFKPNALGFFRNSPPRFILKRCDAHLKRCLAEGRVIVVEDEAGWEGQTKRPVAAPSIDLDARFEKAMAAADLAPLKDEKNGSNELAPLLQSALQCLVWENEEAIPTDVDTQIDVEFTGGKSTSPLHARLRLIFLSENAREEHYCLRAIQHKNAVACQTRLNAAIVQSGIDRALSFRHLSIVRTEALPGGKKTEALIEKFQGAGGQFLSPSDEELRTLHALDSLKRENLPEFQAWLQNRRPVGQLSIVRAAVPSSLLLGTPNSNAALSAPSTEVAAEANGTNANPSIVARSTPTTPSEAPAPTAAPVESKPPEVEVKPNEIEEFELGRQLLGDTMGNPLTMPIKWLEKHSVIFAGAGSGKTVLLKRIVEHAALVGIPSIVIDGANDLAALDERWPSPPDAWIEGDQARADQYHQSTEMIVWTPGRQDGNPVRLEPIPDLAAVAEDREELRAAVGMARATLEPIVATGQSSKSENKKGILASALKYYGLRGGKGLSGFIELLDELPDDAGSGVAKQEKLATEMADSLKTAVITNPILQSQGTPLDPAILFGDDRPDQQRTRISVLSLIGLQDEPRAHFLNQLAMTLFSWIKANPDPSPRPLRGLLVIDEARDFVPSRSATPCKESLSRLVAQARKYHLGIIFATQNPKDIDHTIVSNCATHYYGKVNSPAAIGAIRELIQLKGGSGSDVAKLPRGRFYLHNADLGLKAPVKVASPLCLSCHPANPLDEQQILEKAATSRSQVINIPQSV